MTSGPIPSPGTAAILCLRMRFLSCLGSERAQDALGHAFEVGRAGDVARPCRWACQRPIHRLPHRGGRLDGREYTMRSEEHTSELQSLMRISYAVFCLKKKINQSTRTHNKTLHTQLLENPPERLAADL